MALLTATHLEEIARALEPSYPEEGCGLVLLDGQGALRVHPCENLANALHAEDPETFPRTAKTFYAIDPRELIQARKRGEKVRVMFHSHCDLGDYFSREDRLQATMGMGEDAGPSHPETDYLVVSVVGGKAARATLWSYDGEQRRFVRAELYDPAHAWEGQPGDRASE